MNKRILVVDNEDSLCEAHAERHRLTEGVTWSLGTPRLQTDIRLNYEQCFYQKDAVSLISERNKVAVELVALL